MRTTITVLLAIALVAGGVPATLTLLEDGRDTGVERPTSTQHASSPSTGSVRADDATDSDGAGSVQDSSGDAGEPLRNPLLRPSLPGASPMSMASDLLGPTPDELPRVDPGLSTLDAIAQHPALGHDETTLQAPTLSPPMDHALSRIIQAHGILTALMQASSSGDETARTLVPYAAAQLATESEEQGPVFDAASNLLSLDQQSRLVLRAEEGTIPEAGTLQQEVDRLYAMLGLPSVPVRTLDLDVDAAYASLVRATANVVEATHQAHSTDGTRDAIAHDVRRVDRALADGVLTPDEAALVVEVSQLVHDATVSPLQARLTALNDLYATAQHVGPMAVTTSHDAEHPPGEEDLPIDEDAFVDPLGAIVILPESDDEVNRSSPGLPVTVPGVGTVESLFPQRPLLVLDQGGDDTYDGLPASRGLDPTVEDSEDPLVSEDAVPADVNGTIDSVQTISGTTEPVEDPMKGFVKDLYGVTLRFAGSTTRFDVHPAAETPVQVVIDLDGDDTYTGGDAAAYAAGGATTAIIDQAGDDHYEVDRGIGMIRADGLAYVLDLAGDDAYAARQGIGSVMPDDLDDVPYRLGGLGAMVDVDGNDTYDIGEVGIGYGGIWAITNGVPTLAAGTFFPPLAPQAWPLALDLGGSSQGFQPTAGEHRPNATASVERDDGGHANLWFDPLNAEQFLFFGFPQVRHTALVFAANRTYDADLSALSGDRVAVSDHNVTVSPPFETFSCFISFTSECTVPWGFEGALMLHNEVRVDLSPDAHTYTPEHPLILIDGGPSSDTYIDANPFALVANATAGIFENGHPNAAPMLVLDTGGEDHWLGETAALDTESLMRVIGPTEEASMAGAIIVDLAGNDLYDGIRGPEGGLVRPGNVSTVRVNHTGAPWTLTSLVYDAAGEDTVRDANQVAGVYLRNAATDTLNQLAQGQTITTLFLDGTTDASLSERNSFTAGPGSFGGVLVETNASEEALVPLSNQIITGAVVTAPSDYRVGPHSLASIRWCEDFDDQPRCPGLDPTDQGQVQYSSGAIAALFVGSAGSDKYVVETDEGLGHVTFDPSSVCDRTTVGLDQPRMVTRFIDVAGADAYHILDRRVEVPPWANDHSWSTFPCVGPGQVESTVGEPFSHGVLSDTTIQEIDALGIDNAAQYGLATTGDAASAAAATTGLSFEAPQLCVGEDYEETGLGLTGFGSDTCTTGGPTVFDVSSEQRLVVTTETASTVPLPLFNFLNPCDVGRSALTSNDTDFYRTSKVETFNFPPATALGQGVSGCWGTLELKRNHTQDPVTAGPSWDQYAPNLAVEDPTNADNGWFVAAASPVHCGTTETSTGTTNVEVPVRCATDALPFPIHVDGTEGHGQGRWFLSEGTYDFRIRYHGPLSILLAQQGVVDGMLNLSRADQTRAEMEDASYEDPPGLIEWVRKNGESLEGETAKALAGLQVRAKSQSSTGEPEALEVWSPLRLDLLYPRLDGTTLTNGIVPLACQDGVPLRGVPAMPNASTWRADLGLWATSYELEPWEATGETMPRQPFECADADVEPKSLDNPGTHELSLNLTLVSRGGDKVQVLDLPNASLAQGIVVDETEPLLDAGPLRMDTGDDVETTGVGLDDLLQPTDPDKLTVDVTNADNYDGDLVRFELPIRIQDESPIPSLRVGGSDDHPWEDDNRPPSALLSFLWTNPDTGDREQRTLDCNAPGTDVCDVQVNLTRAGKDLVTEGLWSREATLNLTMDLRGAYEGDVRDLYQALRNAAVRGEPLTLSLPDGIEATDEAGNQLSESVLDEVLVDLKRPSDVPVPCGGEGLFLVTNRTSVDVITWALDEDIQGVVVERRIDDRWQPFQWISLDDMEEADRHCGDEKDGEWRRFTYRSPVAQDGQEVSEQLRTVAVDHAGNRERVRLPFELFLTFDLKEASVEVEQTRTEPTAVGLVVNSDEPVTLQDVHLTDPSGRTIEPVRVPTVEAPEHELSFRGLAPNTTYTFSVTVADQVGFTNSTLMDVHTVRTLNLTVGALPDYVGDNTTLSFTAGALGPLAGGDPAVRVQARALLDGERCAERSVTRFIEHPLDAPGNDTLNLPLTDCGPGDLTVELLVENGPLDEPFEQVVLTRKTIHDTVVPTPQLAGITAGHGWYTQALTVRAAGEDDTGIASANVVTRQGTVEHLRLSESGIHTVEVQVTDLAGRTATETFQVPMDLQRPHVSLVPLDPLPTERSVLSVQVQGSDDASGLRDLRTMDANGSFSPWTPIVDGMQMRLDIRGLDKIVAEVRDRAGHASKVVLPVTSLAEAPGVLSKDIQAAGPGTVDLMTTLDRAMTLEAVALQDGRIVAQATSAAATSHHIRLTPVAPGQPVEVQVRAVLPDGTTVPVDELGTTLTMPGDSGPPTAPGNLTAQVLDDGTVQLSWQAARDDAGVKRYLVQRTQDSVVQGQWITSNTTLLDNPPAGQAQQYRVQAIDLDDRMGPWSPAVSITPNVPLRVLSYQMSPEIATAGEPVSVTLLLEASEPPSQVALTYGEQQVPLTLLQGTGGRYSYQANLTLPTTDTFDPKGLTFQIDDITYPEQGSLPGPLVKVLADEDVPQLGQGIPGPGVMVALLVVSLAATLLRRRWSP